MKATFLWTIVLCSAYSSLADNLIAVSEGDFTHKTITTSNGLNLHVVEAGQGPSVLFLHGFPELWYTWRHQMAYIASKGYRVLAPDLKGYGDSDAPPSPAEYTMPKVVADLVGLLDALGFRQVYLVGHDWGAYTAWYFSLFRPDRIKALIAMSVAFQPRNPLAKPVESLRKIFGENYYMVKFQELGLAEKEFARIGTAQVIKNSLATRDPSPPQFPKSFDTGVTNLPPWLTENDINYYASKFAKTGFTGGLNYYRALDLNWEQTANYTGKTIQVPTKFLVGDLDITYNAPGAKQYISGGGLKQQVPLLEEVVVLPGVAHFLHEEKPEEIGDHIYKFIQKHK